MAVIPLNPAPEDHNPAEKEFLEAVGLCITQWAFVDRQLFRLFSFGLEAKRARSATIYYRQNSLDQRLKLTSNVLEHALADKYKDQWEKPIVSQFKKLLPIRNIIAHHPAKRTAASKDGKVVYIYAIYIEPYELALNKQYPGLQGKRELRVEDLKAHADAVQELDGRLYGLVTRLRLG